MTCRRRQTILTAIDVNLINMNMKKIVKYSAVVMIVSLVSAVQLFAKQQSN